MEELVKIFNDTKGLAKLIDHKRITSEVFTEKLNERYETDYSVEELQKYCKKNLRVGSNKSLTLCGFLEHLKRYNGVDAGSEYRPRSNESKGNDKRPTVKRANSGLYRIPRIRHSPESSYRED